MPYFESNGARLYYEDVGQGRPLIFLHGFGWDMRQWSRQIALFSSEYRVLSLDARGHGKSSLPPGPLPPEMFRQDVIAMMDHARIPSAVFCGSSMGGHVALQVAINTGERVDAMILVGAICTNRFNRYERFVVPINRFCQRIMPMSWIARSIAWAMGKSGAEAKEYIISVVGSTDHDVYNRTWRACTELESREGLPGIKCPTLLMVGDKDTMTRRQQQYLHNNIKNSRLITIPNANHASNLDNPEFIEREIKAFLRDEVPAHVGELIRN